VYCFYKSCLKASSCFPKPLPPLDKEEIKQTDALIAEADGIIAKMDSLIAGLDRIRWGNN
jgi:hypothetical protein